MFRIDNATAAAALPTPAPAGNPGYFTNGNPQLALGATVLDDWWLNQLQEEILNVVTAAGIAPAKGINHQLLDALNHMYTGVGVVGGYLPLTGGTLYKAAAADLLSIQVDSGYGCHTSYAIAPGTQAPTAGQQWLVGVSTGNGNFAFTDQTHGGNIRFRMSPVGYIEILTGDIWLSRQDQATSWIMRPNVAGFRSLGFATQAGTALDNVTVMSAATAVQGSLSAYSATLYQAAAADPLHLQTDNGQNCLVHFRLGTTHEWAIGANTAGNYVVSDITNATVRLTIDTSGNLTSSGIVNANALNVPNSTLNNTGLTTNNISATAGIGTPQVNCNGMGAYSGNQIIVTLGGGFRVESSGIIAFGGSTTICTSDGSHAYGFYSQNQVLYCGNADANGNWVSGTSRLEIYDAAQGGAGGGDMILRQGTNAWKPVGGPWNAIGSARSIKQDIEDFAEGLDRICGLQPVRYRFTAASGFDTAGRHVGLVADDLETAWPELVIPAPPDSPSDKTINLNPLTYALVNAVKELAARLEALEEK